MSDELTAAQKSAQAASRGGALLGVYAALSGTTMAEAMESGATDIISDMLHYIATMNVMKNPKGDGFPEVRFAQQHAAKQVLDMAWTHFEVENDDLHGVVNPDA